MGRCRISRRAIGLLDMGLVDIGLVDLASITMRRVCFVPALAYIGLDIGKIDARFVISNCGFSRVEVHGNAFDARHLSDPFFDTFDT